MVTPVNTVTGIRPITARRAVRVVRAAKNAHRAEVARVAPSGRPAEAPSIEASVVDYVKASPYLQAVVGIREGNRTQHGEEHLLRMVARYLLDSGKDYPRAEVLEVLQAFTGCSPTAAEEALQLMVDHRTVTTVNEVIRVTW